MENQNKDVAANVAANVEEERMHPIFEECEVMNAGKPAREHMLSLNGIYISGITDEQLKEMHEKLTELLTGRSHASTTMQRLLFLARMAIYFARRTSW